MLIVITGWEKSLHEFRGNCNEQSLFIVGVVWPSSSGAEQGVVGSSEMIQ